MQPVYRIAYDSDAFRWLVLAADPSPAGLLRLQTAVEQTFPGVKVAEGYRVTNGLDFALGPWHLARLREIKDAMVQAVTAGVAF